METAITMLWNGKWFLQQGRGGGGGGFGVRASVNSSSLLERDKNIELDTSAAIVAVLKRFVKR